MIPMKKFEVVEHTADLAIKAYGKTLEELFENAAYGMFSFITDLSSLKPVQKSFLKVTEPIEDPEGLLVDFLSELNSYVWKGYFVAKVKVKKVTPRQAEAEIYLCPREGYPFYHEIKAVTYHGIEIKKENDHYTTMIVFDV